MLTPQSENPQNQDMTFTNSQQAPIIQESSINLNQLINTTINAKFIPPLLQLLILHNIVINSITNIIKYMM